MSGLRVVLMASHPDQEREAYLLRLTFDRQALGTLDEALALFELDGLVPRFTWQITTGQKLEKQV
jgi:hypothetical protein